MGNPGTRPSFWEAIKLNDSFVLLQFITGTPIAFIIVDISTIMGYYISKMIVGSDTSVVVSLVLLVNILIAWSKAKKFVYIERNFIQGVFLYGVLKSVLIMIILMFLFAADSVGIITIR